ncbi:cell division protein FtsZ [Candidatus Peribacteria bacterium]|nr:cell division protein FtsZ [Candidatus Peribacteria bacterium]
MISPVASIKVVGCGGAGQNTINRMIESGLSGVDFISINTDNQAIYNSLAPTKMSIGPTVTRGLGAGGDPEKGKKAAEESIDDIREMLAGADMVFVTCGLGGGTGSGSAPVVAEVAKDMGVLVVGVVTKPFAFEGQRRNNQALEAYDVLKSKVDTLITIPNDRILTIIDKKTPLLDAFRIVDEVLTNGVQGISDLITQPGLINVDFADIKSVMQNAGSALMGIGYGRGESRATDAARAAIESPLLELSIMGARGLVFNITGGHDLSMFEVDEAARVITGACDQDANIIFGATVDPSFEEGEIKITVVATGFDESQVTIRKDGMSAPRPSGSSSFGRRVLGSAPSAPASAPEEKGSTDDLDIPAFLRNRK